MNAPSAAPWNDPGVFLRIVEAFGAGGEKQVRHLLRAEIFLHRGIGRGPENSGAARAQRGEGMIMAQQCARLATTIASYDLATPDGLRAFLTSEVNKWNLARRRCRSLRRRANRCSWAMLQGGCAQTNPSKVPFGYRQILIDRPESILQTVQI
jgi:hypothetical protein